MRETNRFVLVCLLSIAACGGEEREPRTSFDDAPPLPVAAAAGRSSPSPRAARWTGTQFCTGSAEGESLKSSEETELAGYVKSSTRVIFSGLHVGPAREYSCRNLELEALVSMSDKSGAFFEGGKAVACTSEAGQQLTATVGIGHDTDLRWIQPTDAPTLSFDVELREVEEPDAGLRASFPAFFRCSFDLELR